MNPMKMTCTVAVLAILIGVASGEPILTKVQVSELGRAILSAKQHKKYREIFDCDKPSYNPDEKLWRFSGGFPVTLGAPFHIFELREKDGYYRLGSISTHSFSPSPPKFRMSPSVRRKVSKMLKTYAEQRKNNEANKVREDKREGR